MGMNGLYINVFNIINYGVLWYIIVFPTDGILNNIAIYSYNEYERVFVNDNYSYCHYPKSYSRWVYSCENSL